MGVSRLDQAPHQAPTACSLDPHTTRRGPETLGLQSQVILRSDVTVLERTTELGHCPSWLLLLGSGYRVGGKREAQVGWPS